MAKKRLKLGIIITVVALCALLLPGYTKLQDLIARNRSLENRIKEQAALIRQLRIEKGRLESDITYIEKVAREKLGKARKDEVVIKEQP